MFLIELAQTDHEKICQALRRRHAARAESLMREHLVNAGEMLAKFLARGQVSLPLRRRRHSGRACGGATARRSARTEAAG